MTRAELSINGCHVDIWLQGNEVEDTKTLESFGYELRDDLHRLSHVSRCSVRCDFFGFFPLTNMTFLVCYAYRIS
jgi:hypothetical protein